MKRLQMLQISYQLVAAPTVEGISHDGAAHEVADSQAENFVETRFIKELEDSDFYAWLYR
jgi:hypothetical protein